MKSAMPYCGVPATPLRAICRKVFVEQPLESCDAWQAAILTLWREAAFREERYVALGLAGSRLYRQYRTLDMLPVWEELIVTGAWWDLVDGLASHELGDLVRAHPAEMKPLMLRWARDEDLWKRRAAILCQIGSKAQTDLELLYGCIEPNLTDTEFFIRKAIGWALRSYAWTDPEEVRRYVAQRDGRLSGLSKREALKNLEAAPPRPG